MHIDILMPALSPSMEKGNLVRWLKALGDAVSPGDILAEIETDKATMEVEATDPGFLTRIDIVEGTIDVPVNQVIGVISSEKAQPPALAKPAKDSTPTSLPGQAEPQVNDPGIAQNVRMFASPIARRLITEAGLDITTITGTGPRGRVVERDVAAAIAARAEIPVVALAPILAKREARLEPVAAPNSDEAIRKLFAPGSYDEVAHDSMRKTIARRLTDAKRTVPHFYLSTDCTMDALLSLREQINAMTPVHGGVPVYRLSVNDFIIKALALALMSTPDANVSFTEETLLRHRHADISVAVAIEGGLVTPIVRKAEIKSLSTISNEMKDLAARARSRNLRPDEFQGGSASISNLGMFGVKEFQAILNPPQATILAIGTAESRIIARDGAAAVATVMTVSLSADHRAVDGATAAQLLAGFKSRIEEPFTMLV